MIQPISATFYPASVLPAWLRPVALLLPSTHVFEGMRQAPSGGGVDTGFLAAAFGSRPRLLVAAALFFAWMVERVREKGYLGRLKME